MAVLEIPSGWLSDRFNRRMILRFSECLFVTSLLFLLVFDGLPSVVISQILLGVAFSFSSGTHEALAYESLEGCGKKDWYGKYLGWNALVGSVAMVAATLVGSWLYLVAPALPVQVWMGAACVSAMASFMLVEPPVLRHRGVRKPMAFWRDMARVFKTTLQKGVRLRAYIVVGALVFATLNVLYWLQQPYYTKAGIPVEWFGALLAGESVLNGLGGWFAGYYGWLLKRPDYLCPRWTMVTVTMFVVVGLLMIAVLPVGWLGAGVFMVLGVAWGYGDVLTREHIQNLAPADMRATVLSIASFIRQVWFFVLSCLVAVSVDVVGIRGVYALAAGLLLLMTAPLLSVLFWPRMVA